MQNDLLIKVGFGTVFMEILRLDLIRTEVFRVTPLP